MNRKILAGTGLILTVLLFASAPLVAELDAEKKVRTSILAYQELFKLSDTQVPESLLKQAKCIAIIPGVIKGAFGFGGRHGRGVMTCRNSEKNWSPPIFVTMSGGSFGFQIGAEATDVVLFFMTQRSAESLLRSKFTLGAQASVAAGPVGRSAEASTDLKLKAEIYSYARSRGLFAGVSLEGARLAPMEKAITKYYGQRLWPDDVLFKHRVPFLPEEAKELLSVLP